MSQTSSATRSLKADISRIIKYAPVDFIGREAETELLQDACAKVQSQKKKRPHILTFVALGGEGKTSLVAKWAADLAYKGWPGCDAVFAWSFYSQGTREQNASSSDLFLSEALSFFGDAAMAGSAAGAFDKGRRLAQLVGERRALLILDGLEPLQYAPTSPTPGELKDQGLAALLKGLAANSHGLCVVTTRYAIPDLRAFIGKTVQEQRLTRLSTEAGVALLQFLGVKGSLRKTIPRAEGRALWNEYEKLVEDVKGHALTLNLLGTYLRDAHAGDIRRRDLIKLEEADAEEQGGHAFRVMDAYVQSFESGGKDAEGQGKGRRALALMQLLGLFDRPATADCLKALWQPPVIAGLTEPLIGISEAQRNLSLKRLEDSRLLTVDRTEASSEVVALDAHPMLRDYFARRMRQQQPEAWSAAHRRLYEHLCATTPDKLDATLEDLQPLYQAVAHGCQADLQKEACDDVYVARILRRNEYYSIRKLGAFGSDLGAVACFFETPWNRISPTLTESDQAWLLNFAGYALRALGRLTEALDPMRAGIKFEASREHWTNAAISAGNLSELELMLGEVAGAVEYAQQSVTFADRSGEAFQRMARLTTYADALHQAGRRAEANARFHEAEQIQLESQPSYPLLYSLRGFQYCDLLLSEAERAAWQTILEGAERPLGQNIRAEQHFLVESCQQVYERTTQTLKWAETAHMDMLSSSLDHLTLGRAALFMTILGQSAIRNLQSEIDAAVSGLRRSGNIDELPRGLLTRAWLRRLTGAHTGPESAQSDLDEAWEIAEYGPMSLVLADIHLYRARLFFRESSYPWESPANDLAAAERLINKHGYHRRDEELSDALLAILSPENILSSENIVTSRRLPLPTTTHPDAARGGDRISILNSRLQAAKTANDTKAVLYLFLERARLYFQMRAYEKARWDYKMALSLCEELAEKEIWAEAELELSEVETRSGLFRDALQHLQHAVTLLATSENKDKIAQIELLISDLERLCRQSAGDEPL
ncbi:MAG TPA: hypothetical protein VJ810_01255 [Blastocatellia bacterium]|nr:hypothetical protein [Blastocatellia bacterium]